MPVSANDYGYPTSGVDDTRIESDRVQATLFSRANTPLLRAFGWVQRPGQDKVLINDTYVPGPVNAEAATGQGAEREEAHIAVPYESPQEAYYKTLKVDRSLEYRGVTAGNMAAINSQRKSATSRMWQTYNARGGSNSVGAYLTSTLNGLSAGIPAYCGSYWAYNAAAGRPTSATDRLNSTYVTTGDNGLGTVLPRTAGNTNNKVPTMTEIARMAIAVQEQIGDVHPGQSESGMAPTPKMADFICGLPADVVPQLGINSNDLSSRYQMEQVVRNTAGAGDIVVPTEVSVIRLATGMIGVVGLHNQSVITASSTIDTHPGFVVHAGATEFCVTIPVEYPMIYDSTPQKRVGIYTNGGWKGFDPRLGTGITGMVSN